MTNGIQTLEHAHSEPMDIGVCYKLPFLSLFNEDCLSTLKRVETGSVDLLLQDTPFGCTQNEWDIKPNFDLLWPEWERVTKENGAMIFFGTQPFASELILSRPDLFKYDIIWYKALGTGFLNANKMPMRNHESILVFYRKLPTYNPQMGVGIRKKGMRKHDRNGTNYGKFATQGTSSYFDDEGKRFPQSVIDFSNGDRTSENDHPTQKPIALLEMLVKTYTDEGDMVLDNTMGSGTTNLACLKLNRKSIGIEKEKEYYNIAVKRCNDYIKGL